MCIVETEVDPDVRQVEILLGKVYLQKHQSPEGRWLVALFTRLAIIHFADIWPSLVLHWCHSLQLYSFSHQIAVHNFG